MQFSDPLDPMANPVCDVRLTEAKLQAPPYRADVAAGGIVEFKGVVRILEGDRAIEGIDYEANRPMAEHQLRLIAEEAAQQFGLKSVTIHHRLGFVPAGEVSLFLQAAAPHRVAAFAASQWMVDELKKRVPIWKRPRFAGEIRQRKDSPEGQSEPILQR